MDSTPIPRSLIRQLLAGELGLGTSCACGLLVVVFWTAALLGLGVFLGSQDDIIFFERTLGKGGSACCFGVLFGLMAASTYLVSRGISKSTKCFPVWEICTLLARLFSFLMKAFILCQATFLLMFFCPSIVFSFLVYILGFILIVALFSFVAL